MRFIDVLSTGVTELRKVGSNLEIFFADTSLVINRHFDSGNHFQVEQFAFADGVVCNQQALVELVGGIS